MGAGGIMKELTYRHTVYACFTGYIVQAIVNNFIPLLFLTFHAAYGIPLSRITLLVTFNFAIQMTVDLLSAGFIDRIGYRAAAVLAHIFAAAGFLLLTVLPEATGDPFLGIFIAVAVYAVGGGLLEVLISPIVEASPTANKEMAMSMLHSFYCWGHVGVVLISTLFFLLFGIENWKYMALAWAAVPILNSLFFARVPISHLIGEGETGLSLPGLLRNRVFWIMILMMICSGASEQAVSQWASAYAEMGLGITKSLGDITGPMLFAVMMGVARVFYGKNGDRINLERFMAGSAALSVIAYLLTALSPLPFLGLIGCAICGLSVGIMWPGTFSTGSAGIRNGGTLMFALFAPAGDVGCSAGPTVVGMVSAGAGDSLRTGILAAIGFPLLMLLALAWSRYRKTAAPAAWAD